MKAVFLASAYAWAVSAPATAWAQSTDNTAPEQTADRAEVSRSIDDIIVTARRREESLQTVPVSVAAFSGEALEQRQVVELRDLTISTPGLSFSQSGSKSNVNITMRGQSKSVVGVGLPAVVTYLNEVPLPTYGSSLPTFDLASIQVLKGPQGTFFGRNTTAGAVLVYTQQPTYNFGGYLSASYGSYNLFETEGAVNVPIVTDKLAARVAWNTAWQDGYTKNLSYPGRDFDNLDDVAVRGSILFEPFEGVRNVTVLDYFKSYSRTGGTILSAANGGVARVPALAQFLDCSAAAAPGFGCDPAAPTPQNDVDLMVERQRQIGNRAQYSAIYPDTRLTVKGLSNTTTIELGAVTFKNIFGLRRSILSLDASTIGTDIPYVVAYNRVNDRQITDEVQFSGSLLDDKLSWLVGGFYLKTTPGGLNGLALSLFRGVLDGGVQNTRFNHNYYRDESKAVFGQLIYDFDGILPGLKANAGYRYTWDKQTGCTTSNRFFLDPRISEAQCNDLPDGSGATGTSYKGSVKSSAPTWTVGLDYQANRDIFFYVTARKGYRGGGFNSPRLGGTLVPFQTFAPEKVTDVEVGSKLNWSTSGMRGRFNLALYRSKVDSIQRTLNSIVPNADGDNDPSTDPSGTTLVYNGGSARIQGMEIDASISPIEGLSLNVGAAYTDPKYTSVAAPPAIAAIVAAGLGTGSAANFTRTPKWTVTLDGRYEVPLGDDNGMLAFNVNYYHSSKVNYDDILQKPFDTVNARIDWNGVMGSNFDLGFFVRNLFDVEYVAGGNTAGIGTTLLTGSLNPPRMVGVQVKMHFGN
jgi:iron complex outermembrane receptor protein